MSEQPKVEPVDAATVILVRHGRPPGSPWQCFMVRRHVRSDFAANVYVFPGGKVDASDWDPELEEFVVDHVGPEVALRDRQGGRWRALKVAGVRELFEEAGVLLAVKHDGSALDTEGESAEHFSRYRKQLHAGSITLADLARNEGLIFTLDALHPFSRWITPEVMPRRYDTRFFVALMPPHQSPLHDTVETSDGVWISPGEALEKHRTDEFPLVFATEKHLQRMTRYRSLEEMIASTAAVDLEPVMPRIVQVGEGQRFLLPGDPGY